MRSKSDKKKSLVPRLRFPEFREAVAWEVKRLGKLVETITPPKKLQTTEYLPSGQFPIIDQSPNDVCGWTDDETALINGEFPLVIFGDHTCVVKLVEGPFAQGADGIKILSPTSEVDARFLFLSLQADPIEQKGYKRHFSTLKEKLIPFPPKDTDEQQKIAHCLSSLDEVIGLQAKMVQALKQHKKGLMQQLFPAEGETTPRLRFPEFREAGAWEVKELIKLAGRGTERNQKGKIKRVLTNSAEHGVLDQREYFDKDIAIQGNLENYFVVDQGDFVYNPRISSFAPVGPISRNDVGKGVMSPLYTVFSFRQSDTDFFAHYFNSSAWHSYMRKVGSTGARHDRMAISNSDFLAMPLSVPNPKEQQKIAHCLSSLDEVIGLESHKLDALKNLKKGLMQQLFPQDVA